MNHDACHCVDVLGTKYTVDRVARGEDAYLEQMHCAGYCDFGVKRIVLLDLSTAEEWRDEPPAVIYADEVIGLRHELIHAFLNESGLRANSAPAHTWAKNEEMVDWFALQLPKINRAVEDVIAAWNEEEDKT